MLSNTTMTLTLLSVLILFMPLLKKTNPYLTPERTIMVAFMISAIPTIITMKYTPYSTSSNLTLMQTTTLDMTMTVTTNMNSNLFLTTALLVTWAIMQFSTWYMKEDPKMKMFKTYLMLFLIAMITLILAGSLLQLFIGWEGVGIMSFLLINWWYSRSSANTSALQAVTYNRIGDIGIIMIISHLAINQTSWQIHCIDPKMKATLMAAGLILAATGKSAQFFMHMWLPSAMEGPTPVSALLHSSTMVVAGIFLLIQMHPIMKNHETTTTTCLYLGATTTVYASLSALAQNDMKKIIALSTLSQLGLMMVAIGLNHPQLAFSHITMHAATKAALFLCAGSFIHNLQNEQDTRKMGNMKLLQPVSSACLVIASFTLMGMPILSCFYSKDPIIETLYTSKINTWAMVTTMLATTTTSGYSLRMIFYTTMKYPRNKPVLVPKESPNQVNPIIRLIIMAMFLGTILTAATQMNMENSMPTMIKMTPTISMVAGILLTMEILSKPNHKQNYKNMLFIATNQLAFFKITHRWTPQNVLKTSALMSTQLTDTLWLEKIGPKYINLINTNIAKTISPLTGLTKTYLLTLIPTTTVAMIASQHLTH